MLRYPSLVVHVDAGHQVGFLVCLSVLITATLLLRVVLHVSGLTQAEWHFSIKTFISVLTQELLFSAASDFYCPGGTV